MCRLTQPAQSVAIKRAPRQGRPSRRRQHYVDEDALEGLLVWYETKRPKFRSDEVGELVVKSCHREAWLYDVAVHAKVRGLDAPRDRVNDLHGQKLDRRNGAGKGHGPVISTARPSQGGSATAGP